MDTIKVYRLEKWDGYGPYANRGDPETEILAEHYKGDFRPDARREGLAIRRGVDICGFISHTKLMEWFRPKELAALRRIGYRVKVYDVPRAVVEVGEKQVVFPKKYRLWANTRDYFKKPKEDNVTF